MTVFESLQKAIFFFKKFLSTKYSTKSEVSTLEGELDLDSTTNCDLEKVLLFSRSLSVYL